MSRNQNTGSDGRIVLCSSLLASIVEKEQKQEEIDKNNNKCKNRQNILLNATGSFVTWSLFALFALLQLFPTVDSIILFQGRTSACNLCDRIEYNSLRNIGCCFKFSKCCIPDNLKELNRRIAAEEVAKRPIRWPDEDDLNGEEDRAVARARSAAQSSRKRRRNSKKTGKQTKKSSTTGRGRRGGGYKPSRSVPSLPRTLEIDDWLKIDVRNGLATYSTM